jgi:hypothetical protein
MQEWGLRLRISICVDSGIRGYKRIRQLCSCSSRLTERPKGRGFIVQDVENGIQLCYLHHIMNVIRKVEQFRFSSLLPHARESTD